MAVDDGCDTLYTAGLPGPLAASGPIASPSAVAAAANGDARPSSRKRGASAAAASAPAAAEAPSGSSWDREVMNSSSSASVNADGTGEEDERNDEPRAPVPEAGPPIVLSDGDGPEEEATAGLARATVKPAAGPADDDDGNVRPLRNGANTARSLGRGDLAGGLSRGAESVGDVRRVRDGLRMSPRRTALLLLLLLRSFPPSLGLELPAEPAVSASSDIPAARRARHEAPRLLPLPSLPSAPLLCSCAWADTNRTRLADRPGSRPALLRSGGLPRGVPALPLSADRSGTRPASVGDGYAWRGVPPREDALRERTGAVTPSRPLPRSAFRPRPAFRGVESAPSPSRSFAPRRPRASSTPPLPL